jgi:hypothetical protein
MVVVQSLSLLNEPSDAPGPSPPPIQQDDGEHNKSHETEIAVPAAPLQQQKIVGVEIGRERMSECQRIAMAIVDDGVSCFVL